MASTHDALIHDLDAINETSFASETDRVKVRNALFAALRRSQAPFDIGWQHGWEEPAVIGIIKTLIDAGLWKKWVANGSHTSHTDTLAQMCGIDPALLKRLLRVLAGQHLIAEKGVDTYALTSFSSALAEERFASLYPFRNGLCQPCFSHFPDFAAETGYKNPTNPAYSNFQSWKGKDQTFFTVIRDEPDLGRHIHNALAVYSNAKTPWTEVYPTEALISSSKTDRALVVDVGGGIGYDLEKFRIKHPHVPNGSLILQELPHVLETAQIQEPCVGQTYDFFTPNPVQGARAYYLHCVLHDWDDVKAAEILRNLAASMEKGYSRILLHEAVIAPTNAHPRSTSSDVVMMMCFSTFERTEEMWCKVVSQAGLKISKIWSSPVSVESVIELELP